MKPNKCWNTSVKEGPGNGFSDGPSGPREESKYSKACTMHQGFVETVSVNAHNHLLKRNSFLGFQWRCSPKFHKLTHLLNGRGGIQTLIIRVYSLGERSMTSQHSRKVKLMDVGNLAPLIISDWVLIFCSALGC